MLETEKRRHPLYRIDRDTRIAKFIKSIRMAVYLTSDRRDEDEDGLCVYLKKTYRAISDYDDIREGDIIKLSNGEKVQVISVSGDDRELDLHLEGVKILDTGAYELEDGSDV